MMVTEQQKTIEAVKMAIKMEIDGKEFYLRASKASGNPLGSRLFQTLAGEEDNHRLKFEEIFKVIQAKKAWPIVDFVPHSREKLKTVFAEAPEQLKLNSAELDDVRAAMEMENKTRDFYEKQAGTASFKAEKGYYESLVKEESAHHAALYDYFEYLKNPAGWFTMKERHSLDGG